MAEMQYYIQLFFVLVISTIAIRTILTRKKKKKHLTPPSPLALPIFGHFHLMSKLLPAHQSFHKLSIQYGPIMKLFLGSVPCIVISSPEIAKEFLKTHETFFSNRLINYAIDYLSYGSQDFMFAPYGEYWKFMKKICMSELLGGRTIDQFRPLRQQETVRFLRLLQQKGEASVAVDVGGMLLNLTNRIITRMTMSKTFNENDSNVEDLRNMVQDFSELAGKFSMLEYIWFCKNLHMHRISKRLKGMQKRMETMMEMAIRDRQEERKKIKENSEGSHVRDLLDILLEIHENKNTEIGIKLNKENVTSFIVDIFLAGTDTSSTTIEWALSELINNPHVMAKAREEIDSLIGKSRLIQESDLPNLPYLQAILKETLRLHPTVPLVVRESSENCNVCGFEIPRKTILFVNLWSMGRDPKLWENPYEFKPERFMSEENKFDVRGQNFQFMPFGTGRRGCPGASLALQAVPTNLAAMIQCFEWKVGGNGTVNMEEKPSTTLPRAHPLICVPIPRFHSFPFGE